jgi:peptidoglycan/xylan/chitin deacetylase (PgdA/CDA1 family)
MAGRINKRELLRRTLSATGGIKAFESLPVWNGLLVLNYHRIGTPADPKFDEALWSATQDDFDKQVRLLKAGFDVIGLSELPTALHDLKSARGRSWKSSRFAMITFDDGYVDNYELAFPVLKTNDAKGVFFVATGFIDKPRLALWDEIAWMVRSSTRDLIGLPENWFDGPLKLDGSDRRTVITQLLRVYYRLDGSRTEQFLNRVAEATGSGRAPVEAAAGQWMTWEMIREMSDAGMDFGAHTVTHPILANLTAEEQGMELCESRLRLERQLDRPITSLSYPVGKRESFNDDTRAALSNNGFDWAFSYYGGHYSGADVDRYDIPRVAIESDVSLADFRAYCALPHIFARH